jgi:hypothetical protein
MDISPLQEFVGRAVAVEETNGEIMLDRVNKTVKYVDYKIADGDPVYEELKSKAGANLRVWLPNTMGTMDYNLTRVNAKDDAGVFRITKVNLG